MANGGVAAMNRARLDAAQRPFIIACALLFVASAAVTIAWCASMSAMDDMPMPGGWHMSMVWMRMPGQTWLDAGAAFLGMWLAMMVAMMLPVLMPLLSRYRKAVGPRAARIGALTMLVGTGYFFVWSVVGLAVFALGVAFAEAAMRNDALARAVPVAAGIVVVSAGLLQFTAWKARQLARCRATPARAHRLAADARTAWRHGLRLGLHCCHCCAGMTAILLVIGVMDLRAMAIVTVLIAAERLAPFGERVARISGFCIVAAGLLSIGFAIGR